MACQHRVSGNDSVETASLGLDVVCLIGLSITKQSVWRGKLGCRWMLWAWHKLIVSSIHCVALRLAAVIRDVSVLALRLIAKSRPPLLSFESEAGNMGETPEAPHGRGSEPRTLTRFKVKMRWRSQGAGGPADTLTDTSPIKRSPQGSWRSGWHWRAGRGKSIQIKPPKEI